MPIYPPSSEGAGNQEKNGTVDAGSDVLNLIESFHLQGQLNEH